MPVPPPVDATQRYPLSIRDFVTYQDQPGDANHIITAPDGVTQIDLTIDSAIITKDLHSEIISMEQTIGAPTYLVPKTTTLGGSIKWLYTNKSTGRVDSLGAIMPSPLPTHYHPHASASGLAADDHPQYMRVDGHRAFSAAVTAPAAAKGNQLITLSQAKVAGLNSSQVETIIQQTLAAQKLVPGEHNITGPDGRRWKMAGGVAQGYTDVNGNLWVDLTPARFAGILSFIYMKMPFPGESMLGWYNYQYMEDQLVLMGLSVQGALIQFIEDIRVDRQAFVCMCWMALGI